MKKYTLKFVIEGPKSTKKDLEALEEHAASIVGAGIPLETASEEVEKRTRLTLESIGLREFAIKAAFITGPEGQSGLLVMIEGEYDTLNYVVGALSICAQAMHYHMKDDHECIFLNSNEKYDKIDLMALVKGAVVNDLWGIVALSPLVGDFSDFSIISSGLVDLGFRDIEVRQVPFNCNDIIRELFGKFVDVVIKSKYPPIGNLDSNPKNGEVVVMKSKKRNANLQFRLVHGGRHGRYRMVSPTRGIGNINQSLNEIHQEDELTPSQFANAQMKAQESIGDLAEHLQNPEMDVLIRAEFEGFNRKEYLWALVTDITDNIYTMKLLDTPQMSIELSPEESLRVSREKIVDWAVISREEVKLVAGNFTAPKEEENGK